MSPINRGVNVVGADANAMRRRVFNALRFYIHGRLPTFRLSDSRRDKTSLRATRQLGQSKIAAVVVEAFSPAARGRGGGQFIPGALKL